MQRVKDEFGIAETTQLSQDIMLKYGLPQGSVVGPHGFILYIHVIGRILRLHNLNYHLYADDIQMYQTVDPKIPGDVADSVY